MKRFLQAAVVAVATIGAGAAWAHGDSVPKHGGIMKMSNDIGYELVVKPDGAEIYIDDHGEPVQTAKLSGKLTVLNGADKSEAPLKPAGGNKLEAKGVKILPRAKVVAAIVAADGTTTYSVRFNVK